MAAPLEARGESMENLQIALRTSTQPPVQTLTITVRCMSIIYECVISHISMSHAMCVNVSCRTYRRVMSRVWTSLQFAPCVRVIGLIHTRDMTHSYVWHESFIRVTRLIHTCHVTCRSGSCNMYEWGVSYMYEWGTYIYARVILYVNTTFHI